MIVKNEVDLMEICRDIAYKHNLPLTTVVKIVKFQYKIVKDKILEDSDEVIQLPVIGKFRKSVYRKEKFKDKKFNEVIQTDR